MKYMRNGMGEESVGSPSVKREWIEIHIRFALMLLLQSPSVKREWIEIQYDLIIVNSQEVSLCKEGVD